MFGKLQTSGITAAVCLFTAIGLQSAARSDEIPEGEEEIVLTQFSEAADPLSYYGISQFKPGSSTAAVRKESIADLPLHLLNPAQQDKVRGLLKSVSLYRRLPTLQFEVEPSVHRFLLDHPDVAVSTWRAMEISKFDLKETAPNFYHGDAGDGSVGDIEVLYRNPDDILIYCDGSFKSPVMVRPIRAKALMRFQAAFQQQADGRTICTHRGDVYVEFPQNAVDAMARIISPVSYSIADRNFKQITLYVHMMSQMMGRQPSWVENLAEGMDGVSPKDKQAMLELTNRCYANTRQRAAGDAHHPPVEEILAPLRQAVDDSEATDRKAAAAVPTATPARKPIAAQPASTRR